MSRNQLDNPRYMIDDRFAKSTPFLKMDGTFTTVAVNGSIEYIPGIHSATAVTFNKTSGGNANLDKAISGVTVDSADAGHDFLSVHSFDYEAASADYIRVILGSNSTFTHSIQKQFFLPNKGDGWTTARQTADWQDWSGTPVYPFTPTHLRLQFQGNKTGPRFAVDSLFGSTFDNQESYVVFCFDDGNESDRTIAMDILAKYGYVGTYYPIANPSFPPNPISDIQLQELVAAGSEIGIHHETDQTTLTEAQVLANMREAMEYIYTATGVVPTSMSWPLTVMDEASHTGVKKSPVLYGRLASWPDGLVNTGMRSTSRLAFPCDALNVSSVADIKTQMDTAKATGMSIITFSHQVQASGAGGGNINTSQLEEAVAHAASIGLKGLTFSELARRVGV